MSMYSESLRAFLKPIVPFLDDPEVTEVMINGPTEIWVERGGKVFRTDAAFSEEGLTAAARNMAQFVGRVLSDERPRLDARLPDGSRIHVVLPPVARRGTTIAIRKFAKDKLSMQRLIEVGAATPALARLIEAAVRLKLNVVVSGGTGSGKTTLLNVLSRFIPDDERILTIEDSAELQLQQPHLVSFESRPPDKFGKGEVSLGDLLNSALRLRPDRIVVGEVRGGECFHLLQAMNTGHGGSLATTHANTPVDTLRRLESLTLMSGIELPMVAIRAQVASAIHLIVCCERFQDGSRKITHASEVLPLSERGEYRTQDLFVYTQTGRNASTGKVEGYHAPTGVLPTFIDKLRANGYGDLDERFFDPSTYRVPPPPIFHHDVEVKTRWAPSLRHREQGLPDPELPAYEPPEPRAKDPEPLPLTTSPLTTETPPPVALPSEEPAKDVDTDPSIAKADEDDDHEDTSRTTREELAAKSEAEPEATMPELKPVAAPEAAPGDRNRPAPKVDEPSIQISEDLLEDMQRVVSSEPTYVKQNPLLKGKAAAPPPPRAAPRPAATPPKKKRDEDDKTDPHIRVPTK